MTSLADLTILSGIGPPPVSPDRRTHVPWNFLSSLALASATESSAASDKAAKRTTDTEMTETYVLDTMTTSTDAKHAGAVAWRPARAGCRAGLIFSQA